MEREAYVLTHFEQAVENGWIQVYYQPVVRAYTKRVCGAEALIRWQSPEMGFLTPNHFIHIFERNGFILKLDYYVLEKICTVLQKRLQKKLPVVPISVNQSGLHMSERGYLSNMQTIADRYKLPRKLVELELTETAFIDFNAKTEKENALQIDFKFLIFQSFFHIELNLLMLEHFVMHKGVKEPDGLVLADDFIAGHHGVVHQDFSINFAMPWHWADTDMVGKTGGDAIDVDDVGSFFNAFGSLFQGIALRFLAEQIGMGDFCRQTMEQNPG